MHFSEGSKPDTNINRYYALISRQTGACLSGTNLISKYVSIFVICFTPIKKWMKIQSKTNCKNKQKKKPLYQLTIPTSPTAYSLPVSHFSSSHFDHRSVDNNSICYNSNPHSCQGHPLASDRERGCAGSRNPDKLSRAYEDFSLASPPRLAINLISLQRGAGGKLTTNWEAVINSSATYIPTQIPMIHSLSPVKSQALTEDLRSAWKDERCEVQQRTHDTYLPEFKSQRQNKALLKRCHP